MWLKVHGVFRQRSSTREMIFDVPTVVSYVSRFMTCCPAISSAPEHRLAARGASLDSGTEKIV
jgi:Fumarylacetoacetate (FAA) hydrolase family